MKSEKNTENLAGSNLPLTIKNLPTHENGSDKMVGSDETARAISGAAFTTFYTWRANGVFKAVRFNHASVKASSRVFVSISEFNSDAQVNRFIGDARMAVYNVAPFNGGFFAWVEISWGNPLNVRFDVFVDP